MEKKTSLPQDEGFVPQDWIGLRPGQRVRVRLTNGETFAAIIETKTSSSNAVWIVRDDNLNTRQVFIHKEGIQLLPIEQKADPQDPVGESPGRSPDSEV